MIVAGFGFRSAAPLESLFGAFEKAMQAAPNAGPIGGVATASDKAETDVFQAFAKSLSANFQGVEANDLEAQTTLTYSRASDAARGTGSVAEAAALAAAGAGARLLGPRVVSDDGMATCALAEREMP